MAFVGASENTSASPIGLPLVLPKVGGVAVVRNLPGESTSQSTANVPLPSAVVSERGLYTEPIAVVGGSYNSPIDYVSYSPFHEFEQGSEIRPDNSFLYLSFGFLGLLLLILFKK